MPCMLRVSSQMLSLSQRCVCQKWSPVECGGYRKEKSNTKICFSFYKNVLWKEKSKGGRNSLCFSIALCYIGDCTCSQFTGLRAHPLSGGLWVMESASGADSLYWCPMKANFSNFRSVWTSSSPWKSVLVSSHCPVFFVWPIEVWW